MCSPPTSAHVLPPNPLARAAVAYSDDDAGGGGGGDDDAEESAVKIQNLYYGAKAKIASDGVAALAGYAEARAYAESRPELSDWAFKVRVVLCPRRHGKGARRGSGRIGALAWNDETASPHSDPRF